MTICRLPDHGRLTKLAPLSPRLVVAAAAGRVGVEGPVDRWRPSFVHHVGFDAHRHRLSGLSSWPLPATDRLEIVAAFAVHNDILSTDWPRPGELYLVWSAEERRFVHSGIVAECEWSDGDVRTGRSRLVCATFEWRKIPGIMRWRVERVRRRIVPERGDRFVRWGDLDGYREYKTPDSSDERAAADICRARMMRKRKAA